MCFDSAFTPYGVCIFKNTYRWHFILYLSFLSPFSPHRFLKIFSNIFRSASCVNSHAKPVRFNTHTWGAEVEISAFDTLFVVCVCVITFSAFITNIDLFKWVQCVIWSKGVCVIVYTVRQTAFFKPAWHYTVSVTHFKQRWRRRQEKQSRA